MPNWSKSVAGMLGTELGEGLFVGILAVLDPTPRPRRKQ